jgi:hypothetical protein
MLELLEGISCKHTNIRQWVAPRHRLQHISVSSSSLLALVVFGYCCRQNQLVAHRWDLIGKVEAPRCI